MIVGGAIIFAIVIGTLAVAIGRWQPKPVRLGSLRTVVFGGIVLPALVLPVLLIVGLLVARGNAARGDEALAIRVIGEQFWWRVEYLGGDGTPLATANEVHIPVGIPVRLILESADVIHSFWVPALGGKLDMIPGRRNEMAIQADRGGVYRGQCAEFCGDQHAKMAFMVVADDPGGFEAWLAAERSPAIAPSDADIAAGASAFLAAGCGACHTVRGTGAVGTIGPDLTHVGSRRTIAAGTLPNDLPSRIAWIAGAQSIKPGSRMPSFTELSTEELRLIATYLGALR